MQGARRVAAAARAARAMRGGRARVAPGLRGGVYDLGMVLYRRSRIANAPYFLTVPLRDRRARHLTERIDDLRAAFRDARARYPFRVEALVVSSTATQHQSRIQY